jgi:predicted secreted protein
MENTQSNQGSNSVQPKNYMVESILVTLFCCLPLGIVAIVNASKVDGAFRSGDIAGAQHASDEAKKWMKYGLISGAVVIGLYVLFLVVFGVSMASSQLDQ